MFDKMKDMAAQIQLMQRLMKDENFRALLAHAKVRELFMDSEFQEIVKNKDSARVMSHPKLAALAKDPELSGLISKLKPQDLFG